MIYVPYLVLLPTPPQEGPYQMVAAKDPFLISAVPLAIPPLIKILIFQIRLIRFLFYFNLFRGAGFSKSEPELYCHYEYLRRPFKKALRSVVRRRVPEGSC